MDQSIVAPHSPSRGCAGVYSIASSASQAVSLDVRIELVGDRPSVSGHPQVARLSWEPVRRVSCVVGRTSLLAATAPRRHILLYMTWLAITTKHALAMSYAAAARRRLKPSAKLPLRAKREDAMHATSRRQRCSSQSTQSTL